ncbi:MAG: TonB-dependent receptor [Bacteroidaceae bacterium]|nr:TonB-dependent receptor [Bacteroidaceae bacterium]
MSVRYVLNLLVLGGLLNIPVRAQSVVDTLHTIDEVTVKARRTPLSVASAQPVQSMGRERLEALGAQSVADAVKRFAGATVRDYGGIGGLKTVSVRNLGAAHTAVSYDGVTVSNAQAGQIDVGRFSLDNVEELSLAVGQGSDLLQSARAYASAGILSIRTQRPIFAEGKNDVWRARVSGGSFGYITPSLRYAHRFSSRTSVMVESDYMRADGIYPFILDNGRTETTEHRRNSDIYSWHVEGNLYHTFKDDSHLTGKGYFYKSERGLPGSVILYNPTARERLWDENFFTQIAYEKHFSSQWKMRALAKYNHAWNRYEDTNVKYEGGRQVDVHRQDEYYASAAVSWQPFTSLSLSLAQDGFVNTLHNNIDDSPNPVRLTSLTALNADFRWSGWHLLANLTGTYTTDEVRSGVTPDDRRHLSPSLSLSWRPWSSEAFYLRALYKNTFRVPTFNDLYYRRSGNTALRPEDATEYNVGLTWNARPAAWLNSLSLTVDAYYNKVEDKIVAFPSVYVWRMANYGEVEIHGVDATLSASFPIVSGCEVDVTGAYTFQQALDLTNPSAKNYKDQLPYTPRHSGNASVLLKTPWLHVGYNVMAVGKRYFMDQNIPSNEIDGYVEHGLTASRSFQLGKATTLRLQADVVNLTDRQYEVIKYYPMPGRSWRVGVNLSF